MKKKIDEDRQPGRFVLTGSANVLSLPKVSDALAGRMEVHALWPLSPSETNHGGCFIDKIFSDTDFQSQPHCDMTEIVFQGGYPDVLKRATESDQEAWCHAYVQTLLSRDVCDLSHVEKLQDMPDLLSLLAARTASLMNVSELSRSSGMAQSTLKRYLAILQCLYLFVEVPAWSKNLSKRLTKSSKIYLNDVHLLLYLLGMNAASVVQNRPLWGKIVENFVVMEIIKQQTWAQKRTRLYHLRTHAGQEIDLILEAFDGTLVAIEVKASQTFHTGFLDAIKMLQANMTTTRVKGVVLYMGNEVLKYGEDLLVLPLSALVS